MKYRIREIEPKDDRQVENIIRTCLIEYGGDHEGTAWADPNLSRFSEIYNTEGDRYWVAEDEEGRLVGGVGIGGTGFENGLCELQKMYCLPEARGTGLAHQLMKIALEFASARYKRCFLETLDNMVRAQRFYEKYGFVRTTEKVAATDHFACEVRYIKEL